MGRYLTLWLDPHQQYLARENGQEYKKSNRKFTEEFRDRINLEEGRVAVIRTNIKGEVAVYELAEQNRLSNDS